MTILAKLFTQEIVPIDLPDNGDRVVKQTVTNSGSYPMTLIENPEHTAYAQYRYRLRNRLREQNLQVIL